MLVKLIDSDQHLQPLMCCVVCREAYVIFDKHPTITLDEVLDMHYAMEHE